MRRPTLLELSQRLVRRETTSRALVEESLQRIADPTGEGAQAFLTVSHSLPRARRPAGGVHADRRDRPRPAPSRRRAGRGEGRQRANMRVGRSANNA